MLFLLALPLPLKKHHRVFSLTAQRSMQGCAQGSWWTSGWSSPPRSTHSGTWEDTLDHCCRHYSDECPLYLSERNPHTHIHITHSVDSHSVLQHRHHTYGALSHAYASLMAVCQQFALSWPKKPLSGIIFNFRHKKDTMQLFYTSQWDECVRAGGMDASEHKASNWR